MVRSVPSKPCATLALVAVALFAMLPVLLQTAAAQSMLDDVHVAPLTRPEADLSPQIRPGGAVNPAFRAEADLVLVPVSVTDDRQRLVTGLGRDNFEIFDGRQPQVIQHFSSEDMPLSIGLIVDISGSMQDKMGRVREAVTKFCESANLQDEFFLIAFADRPELVVDFTESPAEIDKRLLFAQPRGGTALLDAVYMGLNQMRHAKYGKRALLIISDGGDNHSRRTEHEVMTMLKESDVAVYAIGTFDRNQPTDEELRGPLLLSLIAEPTGGRAFTIEKADFLPEVARLIGRELRVQYVLGYRPSKLAPDGKWHKVHVKLRVPAKLSFLQAHAKSGYYAAAR